MKKRFFTRSISVVVSESMYQQLIELTQKTDYSLCEWIRDAIALKLENLNLIVEKER
jgi:Arc/MetJ-type ribon-helix-helix transcriptional regulator